MGMQQNKNVYILSLFDMRQRTDTCGVQHFKKKKRKRKEKDRVIKGRCLKPT